MCVCDCVSVCIYSLFSVCVNVTDGLWVCVVDLLCGFWELVFFQPGSDELPLKCNQS